MARRSEELAAPSINAALIRSVTVTGELYGGKASGTIVDIADELYLLTNWHVATGRHWMTPDEEAHWDKDHPGDLAFASKDPLAQFSPHALEVQIPLSGKLLTLARLDMDSPLELDDQPTIHRYAWDDPTHQAPYGSKRPPADLVCLHLGSQANHWSNLISGVAGQSITLGYQLDEVGLDHEPQVGDAIFVVGYPRRMGNGPLDPPAWTSGSIATPPHRAWNGDRFLIDSRTREGQSGSAVIAYAPSRGGLPARHQLLAVYSGRIDDQADIGSAWWVDDIIDDVFKGTRRPRARSLSDSIQDDNYILKDIDLSG